jgi:hypothetical protein
MRSHSSSRKSNVTARGGRDAWNRRSKSPLVPHSLCCQFLSTNKVSSENVEGLHSFTVVETLIRYLNSQRRRVNMSELMSRNASAQLQKDLIEYFAKEFREKIQNTGKVRGHIVGMTWWRDWCRYVQFNPHNVRDTTC